MTIYSDGKSLQQSPLEPVMDYVRDALIACLRETGHAHFEIDCAIINKEKDIVRIQLMLGTKYTFTISRKEIGGYSN